MIERRYCRDRDASCDIGNAIVVVFRLQFYEILTPVISCLVISGSVALA